MKLFKQYINIIYILTLLLFCVQSVNAGPRWYDLYKTGVEAAKAGNYELAIKNFQEAVKYEFKDSNSKRVGVMRTKYFPHREMGICLYKLGDYQRAHDELSISLQQSPSKPAREFIKLVESKTSGGISPANDYKQPPVMENKSIEYQDKPAVVPSNKIQLIGERLSIAVLPFETKGVGRDLGDIDLIDKLITELHRLNRFKVIERSQLEKILKEQKLGLTGIIDQSTAVDVGKTAGVDAVVFGSITCGNKSVSIDARLVDTETAEIITSRDAFSKSLSLLELSKMINELTLKINSDMPIIDGIVLKADTGNMMVDMGSSKGIKKNMKCHVYRDGEPVIHPVSGDTLDIQKEQICEMQIIDVFDGYSKFKITNQIKGVPQVGDRVQTK